MDYKKFKKQDIHSVFDKEYDYIISLGHRCCVALANGYTRKSSFPLDWQITRVNLLPKLFEDEFREFYPNSGVEFAHQYHKLDENGSSVGIDVELTQNTLYRRCQRLVDLIKRNDRKLLFVRSKYLWYWCKREHVMQSDQNSLEYDIEQLAQVSRIIKEQYKNDKSDFLYIHSALRDEDEFNTGSLCEEQRLRWRDDGTIEPADFIMPGITEQLVLAEKFDYEELPVRGNIHSIQVQPHGVRTEAMSYNSKIFDRIKISDVKDF